MTDYSAIVALGNLMSKEGCLNNESASRLDVAIDAFNRQQAPYVITCGWAYRDDSPVTIAAAMKKYAVDKGVPADAVLTEENSRDTVGDAVFTRRNFFLPKGWDKILVVTSNYHVARTQEIFSFVFGEQYSITVAGADSDQTQGQMENEERSTTAFRETFTGVQVGDEAAIYTRLSESHPFYNGQIHPGITC